MHPELIRALGKARHDDLLGRYPPRARPRTSRNVQSPRFVRSRRRVGALLIWTGARVIGDRQAALELAQE